MLRITFITKYPPIEGGVSSQAYWFIKGLGESNVKVDVITNCWEVESKYRININVNDLQKFMPKNVHVFSTDPFDNPEFIPYFKSHVSKLSNLAIDLTRENSNDVIDSWYLLPYGVSAFVTHILTQIPFILRHGGSDITRLYESASLNTLFTEILKKAKVIYTVPSLYKKFLGLNITKSKLLISRGTLIDLRVFNPKVRPFDLSDYFNSDSNTPIITYIGKFSINKGIFQLIDAASKLKNKNFRILFITNDDENNTLKKYIRKKGIKNKATVLGFVPPWVIPSIITASTCVVLPEHDFPVSIHNPRIGREVLACGKCLVISEDLTKNEPYSKLKDGVNALIINPKNIKGFSEKLNFVIDHQDIVDEIGRNARRFSETIEDYKSYIKFNILTYKRILGD